MGSGDVSPFPPRYHKDQGTHHRPSVRDEETWRWQLLLTGAVPAALHTAEDIVLQFFPLLFLRGQALGGQLGRALAAVQYFAVLCVPQVCVQAARSAEE